MPSQEPPATPSDWLRLNIGGEPQLEVLHSKGNWDIIITLICPPGRFHMNAINNCRIVMLPIVTQ